MKIILHAGTLVHVNVKVCIPNVDNKLNSDKQSGQIVIELQEYSPLIEHFYYNKLTNKHLNVE